MNMRNKKILIACDSFKGACSSLDSGNAIKRGLMSRFPDENIKIFSVGDGGEGTADTLISSLACTRKNIAVHDTHGYQITAKYGVTPDKSTAVFDMASCCGIGFAKNHGLDIMSSTTYGVGEMILASVEEGVEEIVIGLGGSGTSDGGIGALSALGVKFYDQDMSFIEPILRVEDLKRVCRADFSEALSKLKNVKITLLYDSGVKLLGENGAVMLYSCQKGATEEMLPILEESMSHFAMICDAEIGNKVSQLNGSGAAGGLGYGLSLIGGRLTSGADYVLERIGFDTALRDADIVITGEGKTDSQTITGKLPVIIAAHAMKFSQKEKNPIVVCLCGVNDAPDEIYSDKFGITAVIQIGDRPMTLEDSISSTELLLEKTAKSIAGLLGNT